VVSLSLIPHYNIHGLDNSSVRPTAMSQAAVATEFFLTGSTARFYFCEESKIQSDTFKISLQRITSDQAWEYDHHYHRSTRRIPRAQQRGRCCMILVDDRDPSDVEPEADKEALRRKCTFLRRENVVRCKTASTAFQSSALETPPDVTPPSGSLNTTSSKCAGEMCDRICVTHGF
jgi:hypothetical protein